MGYVNSIVMRNVDLENPGEAGEIAQSQEGLLEVTRGGT